MQDIMQHKHYTMSVALSHVLFLMSCCTTNHPWGTVTLMLSYISSLCLWSFSPQELSAEQSHGKITKYELSWDGRAEVLQPAQHCVNVSTDGVGRRVTITAWNSAGSSPTSTITIPTPPAGQTCQSGHINTSVNQNRLRKITHPF